MDHGRTIRGGGSLVGLLELLDRVNFEHVNAPRASIRRDVHASDRIHILQVRAGPTLAILRAKALGAARLGQGADRCEAIVLQQDVDDLDTLLGDRGQLHRKHLVGAVTDDRDNLGLRTRQLDAHGGRDLVTHAGEGVLDVVLDGGLGLPQGLQVAGHRAGSIDNHVLIAHQLVKGAEDLSLRGQRGVAHVVALLHLGGPGLALGSDLGGVGLVDAVVGQLLGQGNERLAGVSHDHLGALLGGVEGRDIDVDEGDVGVLELRLRGRREVGVARAHTDDQVGLVGQVVARVAAGGADTAHGAGVIAVDGALTSLRVRHRDTGRGRECAQLLRGLGVDGAAAGDDEGTLGGADLGHRTLDGGALGRRTAHVPHALGEELDRPVVGLGLNVLGQGDRHGTGLGRVGQDAHAVQERGDQLLGTIDAVEEARDGTERVIDSHVERGRILELLEDRVRDAGRELVGGEDEDGQAVGRRGRGAGHHVQRAGADRRSRHPGLQAVRRLGECRGRVDGALLVAGHDVGHRVLALGGRDLILQQGLTDAGNVTVTEDAEGARDEAMFNTVTLGVLVGQEANDCLCNRQAHGSLVGFFAHG